MSYKGIATFVGMLLGCIPFVYGRPLKQQPQLYPTVESPQAPKNQIKAIPDGKYVQFFTVAGFIRINATHTFQQSGNRLYYRTQLTGNPVLSYSNEPAFKVRELYVLPGQNFLIDVLDRQTDTLVGRYTIKRPILIPKVQIVSKSNASRQTINTPFVDLNIAVLKLSPDQTISFINHESNFNALEMEYTLLNLKTKEKHYQISSKRFETLNLLPGTEYKLTFNYVLQKESGKSIYIQIKPYWYQSAIAYIILFSTIVITALLFIALSLKGKIKSSGKKQQRMEEAAIRLQSLLNPHFTFNALSTIQGLMNTNRIEEANQYLQEFSALLRHTLTKSKQIYTPLDQELQMMRMYIGLEALRFNFLWDIEVDDNLNPSVIEIPTMLLQPLIENSIKHGLSGLGEHGQLLITCKKGHKKDTFVIVVKDNGRWAEKPVGYGLSLTAERIKTINKIKKEQAIVLEFQKQSGTEAILTFHNWIND